MIVLFPNNQQQQKKYIHNCEALAGTFIDLQPEFTGEPQQVTVWLCSSILPTSNKMGQNSSMSSITNQLFFFYRWGTRG